MDELLIPNVGPNKLIPWPDSKSTSLSDKDNEKRPFGCTFLLEDARARVKNVALKVEGNIDFHLKGDETDLNFYLKTNDQNLLSSIVVGCDARNKDEALQLTLPHVLRLTSMWCLKYRRPVSFYALDVFDNKHKAKWIMPSITPSVIPTLEQPKVTMWNTALTSLVAVFREGMTSNIHSHKFMSYYKILEAYPSNGPFLELVKYCENNGIEFARDKKNVTKELLHGAYAPSIHDHFLGMKYTKVKNELSEYRNSIAHPFIQTAYQDLDTYDAQVQLVGISNLLERMAIDILEDEFKLMAQVSNDKNFEIVHETYTKT